MPIDWSLAKTPDFVGNAYAARAQGIADRREQDKFNAYKLYSSDPTAGIKAIAAFDPVGAGQLEDRQVATQQREARKTAAGMYAKGDATGARTAATEAGDFDLIAQLDKLDDRSRAEVGRRATLGVQVGQALLGLKTPQEREAYILAQAPTLKAQGLSDQDIAGIPRDDATIDAQTRQSLSVTDALAKADSDRTFAAGRDDENWSRDFRGKQFAETVRSNRVGEAQRAQGLGLEGQRVQIARQAAADAANGVSKATRRTEADLRKEFNALSDVKNYRTVATQAAAVRRLAGAPPSAQGDIAMTYATMKAYDPTSVVRETEFATAQNAAGVPDRIRNQWNKVLSGQRLNPKQRAEMASTVNSFADTYKQRYETVAGQYRGYAADYDGNPDRVVALEQATAPPANRPPLSSFQRK